jgi:hypothetical protein
MRISEIGPPIANAAAGRFFSIAFSSEVETGLREENASKQKSKVRF